ncbi:hypothetical protein Bbelb_268980 [Branchiostoma belcheri]|nr:hypothetical protein Bbelb_268980 [Branchiostoma belcheri]
MTGTDGYDKRMDTPHRSFSSAGFGTLPPRMEIEVVVSDQADHVVWGTVPDVSCSMYEGSAGGVSSRDRHSEGMFSCGETAAGCAFSGKSHLSRLGSSGNAATLLIDRVGVKYQGFLAMYRFAG